MSDRTKTILAWAIALLVVAACGMSALLTYQGVQVQMQSTMTGWWQGVDELRLTSDAILATSYALQTVVP